MKFAVLVLFLPFEVAPHVRRRLHNFLLYIMYVIYNSEPDSCSGYLMLIFLFFYFNSREKEKLKIREEKEATPLED